MVKLIGIHKFLLVIFVVLFAIILFVLNSGNLENFLVDRDIQSAKLDNSKTFLNNAGFEQYQNELIVSVSPEIDIEKPSKEQEKTLELNYSEQEGFEQNSGNPLDLEPFCDDFDYGLDYKVDSKISYFSKGDISVRTSNDVCLSDKILSEQYCEGIYPRSKNYICPAHCVNNVCIELSCVDEDDGKNLDIASKTFNELESHKDVCYDIHHVKEYFCAEDGLIDYEIMQCPEDCRGGICVPKCDYVKEGVCNTVKVAGASSYSTSGKIKIGFWADSSFVDAHSNFDKLLLDYFNSMNKIYAEGENIFTGQGNHTLSFILNNNEVYILNESFTNDTGEGCAEDGVSFGEVHWDLYNQIQEIPLNERPDVNVLVIDKPLCGKNPDKWYGVLGVSNGVGTGQALVGITGQAENDNRYPYLEEWWGSIIAHEVGHAIGKNGHVSQCMSVMCCSSDDCCNDFTQEFVSSKGDYNIEHGKYPADEWKSISNEVMQRILDENNNDDSTYSSAYWVEKESTAHYPDLNNFIIWN